MTPQDVCQRFFQDDPEAARAFAGPDPEIARNPLYEDWASAPAGPPAQ